MSDSGPLVFFVVVIPIMIAVRLVAGRLDRQRIREHVETGGGEVLDIAWNPFGPGWWGSRERIYDVRYKTRLGEIRTSTCKTSMSAGVYWTGHGTPSGLDGTDPTPTSPIKGDVDEPVTTPAEPITCLACGTRIPARQTRCLKCGWSYKGQ